MTRTPYITILLDRSGSMASSRADALAAVNGYRVKTRSSLADGCR